MNSPIISTIKYTTVGELVDATSLKLYQIYSAKLRVKNLENLSALQVNIENTGS